LVKLPFRPPRPPAITIERLTAAEVAPFVEQIGEVYGAAFAPPPYNRGPAQVPAFVRSLMQHAQNPDFCCCFARATGGGRLLGFTYGYTGRPGQWWRDVVAASMEPNEVRIWLDGQFEFVELAVVPEAQGHGIGGRLHDALLEGQRHKVATLSTIQQDTAAFQLYRKRGWVVLLQDVAFPFVAEPYRIMGIELNQWRSRGKVLDSSAQDRQIG